MNIFGFDYCLKLRLRDTDAGYQFGTATIGKISKALTAENGMYDGKVFYVDASPEPDFVEKVFNLSIKNKVIHSGGNVTLLFDNNKERKSFLDQFRSCFAPVAAAGGIPVRPDGKILMIFRKGVWDLAKGKLEKGETIREGALREVQEETGIGRITIGNPLPDSYHIFKGRTKWRFKTTHWFMMPTDYDGELVPQQKEGITAVKWKNLKKLYRNPPRTYPLILDIIRQIRNLAEE